MTSVSQEGFQIDERDRITVLTHYYRAMVSRADVWRMRMDATTNWAIGATAAVISFALGNPDAPHYVVLLAPLMTVCFLLLEARRLTFHRLWQDRVMLLERSLVRPAIEGADPTASPSELDVLAPQLGTTVPTMRMRHALARRLRRVYGFLFGVQGIAWGLKLANHPAPADSLQALVARAHVGLAPGAAVIGAVIVAFVVVLAFAIFFGGPRGRDASIREESNGSA